jgi:hypothetical protein
LITKLIQELERGLVRPSYRRFALLSNLMEALTSQDEYAFGLETFGFAKKMMGLLQEFEDHAFYLSRSVQNLIFQFLTLYRIRNETDQNPRNLWSQRRVHCVQTAIGECRNGAESLRNIIMRSYGR